MENEGSVITPGGFYYIFADSFYKEGSEKVPKEAQSLIPFELYLRSENGKQHAATCYFLAKWENGVLRIYTQTTSIRQRKWPVGAG